MPYVQFDASNNIVGTYAKPQSFATTFLADTDPGLVKWTLLPYAKVKHQTIMGGGISVNVGTAGAPNNVEASTDPASLVLLQGAYSMATANAGASFQWVQPTGVSVTLTSAQMITIFNAVTAFLQATFNTLAAVIAAIGAGTVTTTAQVDSFSSPAWPSNS